MRTGLERLSMGHTPLRKFDAEVETAEDALRASGADFIVGKHALLTDTLADVPGWSATVRQDTGAILGVVGSRYGVVQNTEAFAFFDEVVRDKAAVYTGAGVLDGGRYTIIQARVNGPQDVRPGDAVQNYITLVNGHDGHMPLKAWFSPYRIWCSNQLRANIKGMKDAIAVRHTANVAGRMNEAMRILGCARDYFDRYVEAARRLADVVMTRDMVARFLDEVVGESERVDVQKRRDAVENLIESGAGNTGRTLWDAYGGLTEWSDWDRVDSSSTDPADVERRFRLSLWSNGLKEKAWEFVTAEAGI